MSVNALPQNADVTAAERINRRDALKTLAERDNVTNFLYIGRIYAIMIAALVTGVYVSELYRFNGVSGWVAWPLVGFVVMVIGASQHQLGAIIHEGTHYVLFKNRKLNEFASDWLGGFPIYTSTQAYRLHHFAHHQFVNDPDRDPIATQAAESGHWLDFPVTHVEMVRGVLNLIWPVNLIRYMVARAKHSAMPNESNPFTDSQGDGNALAIKIGVIFAVLAPIITAVLVAFGMFDWALAFLGTSWFATILFYLVIPEKAFPLTQIKTVISDRITTIGRTIYIGSVYMALTVTQYATGVPAWDYFGVFWILPLFTFFPIFMVLREWVQHGNADRGRYTNSRVFLVDPVTRYAVFPLGMDYHLPHHLYASVPHYNLKKLHEFLLGEREYAQKGRVVRGWLKDGVSNEPSVMAVLGPDHAIKSNDVYVDEATVAEAQVRDSEKLNAENKASRAGRIW